MSSITEEQWKKILELLKEENLNYEEIAEKVGVSPWSVRAVKAHLTRGTYENIIEKQEDVIEAFETTFGVERDLQLALRQNIEQLEKGLKIIDDGKETATEAGRIDILTEDKNGNIVVVELKAGSANPDSVAQILSYMGAVSSNNKANVRGILVAGDFPSRVIYAARAVPNLQLKKYTFKFSFENVQ